MVKLISEETQEGDISVVQHPQPLCAAPPVGSRKHHGGTSGSLRCCCCYLQAAVRAAMLSGVGRSQTCHGYNHCVHSVQCVNLQQSLSVVMA